MYTRLKDIFHNVNEWLKFAEAKHAGFIVLNSGILFGVLSVHHDHPFIPRAVVFCSLLFIGLSIFFSFLSLFPRKGKRGPKPKAKGETNLFFSGHLMQYDKAGLMQKLAQGAHEGYVFDKLEEDLIEQIIVNAEIASLKYRLFKWALIATISAFALPLLFAMGYFMGMWQ